MGKLKMLEIREAVKAKLGEHFDERAFHKKLLENGAMPMDELSDAMLKWANRRRGQLESGAPEAEEFSPARPGRFPAADRPAGGSSRSAPCTARWCGPASAGHGSGSAAGRRPSRRSARSGARTPAARGRSGP